MSGRHEMGWCWYAMKFPEVLLVQFLFMSCEALLDRGARSSWDRVEARSSSEVIGSVLPTRKGTGMLGDQFCFSTRPDYCADWEPLPELV